MKMIVLPGSQVYHRPGCRYLNRGSADRWKIISLGKAAKRKFRPCKCCGTLRFQILCEREALDQFIRNRSMEYKIDRNIVYVKTEISCWKIVCDSAKRTYALYHRNHSPQPVDFQHPEKECYHRQMDEPHTNTLMEQFRYIRGHDAFKKAEREMDGDLKRMSVSPKYKKQAVNRQRRQRRRRLDALFAEIERKNPEYAALAYC